MRLVRCTYKSQYRWGILKDADVVLLKEPPFRAIVPSKTTIPVSKLKFAVPAEPTKIVLVGLNYRDHAAELNMPLPIDPVIFLKPPTALLAHKQKIVLPRGVDRLDYEAEMALVMRKEAKNIPVEDAAGHILGYTCLNDVTARDMQKKDGQWTRAKSFDTFCPVGPWVETAFDPSASTVLCRLNGSVRQRSQTANLIFSVPYLVSFVSRVMRLFPGDIISTGTPPGVGAMKPGDRVEVEVCGIGTLENRVVEEHRGGQIVRTVCIVVMTCMIQAAAAGFVFAQEFSAATRNVYQDRVQEGKVYISENKIRFETAGVINIIRLDKKILLSLDPGRKSYVETILPPDHIPSFRGELPGEIHRTFICSETLDGRDVDKYIVITKGFEGNKNIHIWVAKDISWPIKRKSTDGSWESTLSDIAIGPQPPELFEVPEGYRKEVPQE